MLGPAPFFGGMVEYESTGGGGSGRGLLEASRSSEVGAKQGEFVFGRPETPSFFDFGDGADFSLAVSSLG
jgi:hypothetical protein